MSTLLSHLPEIQDLVLRYRIRTVMETGVGTALGVGGLAVAEMLGLRGLSCDINEARCEVARARFLEAVIRHGTSTAFLEAMLPLVHGPAFVYLDAHLAEEDPIWPLWDELNLLRGYEHHVIWCDDIQHIKDPANPACKDQRVGYTRQDGTVWPGDTKHTLAEYIACLDATHDAAIAGTVLKFTPKTIV